MGSDPFRLACEARKTPEFQELQAKYLELQAAADAIFMEIQTKFEFPGIYWSPRMSGDIMPAHRSLLVEE